MPEPPAARPTFGDRDCHRGGGQPWGRCRSPRSKTAPPGPPPNPRGIERDDKKGRPQTRQLLAPFSAIEIATGEEDTGGPGADPLVEKPPARDRRKSCVGGWHGRGSLVTRADRDRNECQKGAT